MLDAVMPNSYEVADYHFYYVTMNTVRVLLASCLLRKCLLVFSSNQEEWGPVNTDWLQFQQKAKIELICGWPQTKG